MNMFKRILMTIFSFLLIAGAISISYAAPTILQPGDIFIITTNASDPDSIEFVSRVDIETGTTLYITENAWNKNNTWRTGEGILIFKSSSFIPATTKIRINNINSTPILLPSKGSIVKTGAGTWDLSTDTENIFLYQGSGYNTSSPTFLYGLGFGGSVWINTGTTTSKNSYIPSSLVLGQTAVEIISNNDNIQYNCSNVSLLSPSFKTDINNPSNWNTSNIIYGSSPCVFNTSEEPILEISLGSGQADYTSGTTLRFQVQSTEPIDITSFTCSDTTLTGEYDSATCTSIADISLDKTVFEVMIDVDITTFGYGDISFDIIEGSVKSIDGLFDIGSIIVENYVILDNQAPVITLNGSGIISIEAGSAWSDPGATCVDNLSGCNLTITGSVDTSLPGSYFITYTATDELNNKSQIIRTITVIDLNAPIITLYGSGIVTLEAGSTWIEPGATCVDNVDPSCTVIITGLVNTLLPGSYTLTYSATDNESNMNTIQRIINIIDTTKPTISLNGSSIISIEVGTSFLDLGATWSDIVDGTGTVYMSSGSIDINTIGNYIISYQHTDAAGNESMIIERTINIEERPITTSNDNSGGGGYTLKKDSCPDGDQSSSYYDGICREDNNVIDDNIFNPSITNSCFTPGERKTRDQGNKVSQEFKNAHQLLYSYHLTTKRGTQEYRPDQYLTREQAARFMVEFSQNILCRAKTRSYSNTFSDLTGANPTLIPFIKLSYEYEIFNGHKDGTFRPTERVTNDELAAIMVRLVTHTTQEEPEDDWAAGYRTILASYTSGRSLKKGSRGNIAEVIFSLYRYNDYTLQDIGYVIR